MLPISQLPALSFRSLQGQAQGQIQLQGQGQATPAAGAAAQAKDPRSDGKSSGSSNGGIELSDEEKEMVRKLAARDSEVRAHEQAHAAAGGAFAGAPSFSFQRGPDGQNYAIGGEVPIDISPVSGDPQATITKMLQVKRAALAPAEPSGADRAIAASADSKIVAARQELMKKSTEEASVEGSARETSSQQAPGAADSVQDESAPTTFNAFERRNASVAAYSASRSYSPSGIGLDLQA